jgi:citronellol/citronellal dehydrogenase
MNEVAGRVAVVTGASRGIGAAIATRLATAGARVAAAARTVDTDPRYTGTLSEVVARIHDSGGEAIAVRTDLSRPEDRRALVDEVADRLGPIDILVNNAAVTWMQPVAEMPLKRFDLMHEVQVRAPFELCQLVLPGMYERGHGWILNISSRAAVHPEGPPYSPIHEQGFAAYGMVKAALERMTTALAAESYSRGVRVNALAPWDNVATPGAAVHDLVDGYRLEDPSVIAEAALALVSGDMTGRIAYSQQLVEELRGR